MPHDICTPVVFLHFFIKSLGINGTDFLTGWPYCYSVCFSLLLFMLQSVTEICRCVLLSISVRNWRHDIDSRTDVSNELEMWCRKFFPGREHQDLCSWVAGSDCIQNCLLCVSANYDINLLNRTWNLFSHCQVCKLVTSLMNFAGPRKAREAYRHFGPAPGVPHSHTKWVQFCRCLSPSFAISVLICFSLYATESFEARDWLTARASGM